jgi:hypothetical protein
MISTIPVSPTTHSLSFQTTSEPDSKFAPIVVSGALFVGKAIVGGAIGTAASWGTSRFLDSRFPPSKK